MEFVDSKKTGKEVAVKGPVCVTGASGYLASWLVKRLLSSGYHVIGTVRDPGNCRKVEHLWKLEGAQERLQLVKANLMEDGSFDDAIMGCVGVFHTASPVMAVSDDPKIMKEMELIASGISDFDAEKYAGEGKVLDPAITGTLNVLRSCKKNPTLKRVVITSSSAAVRIRRDAIDPNIHLDESSWSNVDVDFCKRFKVWYSLSKTLAERAAWEFAKENKIDLVTVLPSFIVGPSLPTDLSPTASDILALLRGESEKFSWYGRMGYVDIDDVACCHILVFEDPSAEGRYLCSSKVLDNHELASFLAKRYPYLPIPKRFENPWGNALYYEFNTSKLCNLGFKFKGMEEMFDYCIASLKEQGHIPY